MSIAQPQITDSSNQADIATPFELIWMGVAAIALRGLVVLLSAVIYHKQFTWFVNISDGPSFIAYARAMLGEANVLTDYDRRVFIGYPLLIAGAHFLGVPLAWGAYGISWISAGAAAVLAAVLTRSRRLGWAMVCLTPHYVLYSSIAMTESPLLAFDLAGIALALRAIDDRLPERDHRQWLLPLLGGLVLGFAGVIRPFACFAIGGLIIHAILRRKWMAASIVAVISAGVFGGALLGLKLVTGNAFIGVKAYKSRPQGYPDGLFTYPFQSLISQTFHGGVNPLKAIYIWLYVLVNLTALALLARQWFKEHNPNRKTDLYFIWLAGNTAVLLCVGGVWGFHAYHRYSAWALPAELVCFIPILPRRAWIWILVAAVSVAIAVSSMMRNMVGI
jgi:hypothetical protein